MTLPFTPEQFFEMFAEYNRALWFAVVVWWLGSLGLVVAAWRHPIRVSRPLTYFLGALWIWNAAAYHAWFFTRINPAAWLFATIFVVQAGLLFIAARNGFEYFSTGRAMRALGLAIIVYALIYPALTHALGHPYPFGPTFGVPCPTTLLTIGLLVTIRGGVPVSLGMIPVVWAVIGGSAALLLNVATDYALLAAGGLAAGSLVTRGLLPGQGRAEEL